MDNSVYKKLSNIKKNGANLGLPLYEQLRQSLEAMIISGEMPDNLRLPPDKKFASMIGVNHITLGKALNELRKQGLIGRSRSYGTYVKSPPKDAGPLSLEQNRLVALIFDDVNPLTFQSDLFVSIHGELQKNGLEMLFLSSSGLANIQYEQIKGILQKPNCCGCVVWSVMNKIQVQDLMDMKPTDFPLVFLDKNYDGIGHDYAVYDNFNAAIELCNPFIQRDCQKYVFLVREKVMKYSSIHSRYLGIREAFSSCNADSDNGTVYSYNSPDEIDISELNKQCENAVLIAAHTAEVEDLMSKLSQEGKDIAEFSPFAAFGPSPLGKQFDEITEFKFSVTGIAENAVNILISRLNGDRGKWKELKSGGTLYEKNSSFPNDILCAS